MNKSPVLFLIFNRPDTTQKIFEAIRAYQPNKLFIAADGPRSQEEKKVCAETRKIVEMIDWPCQISHLYRSENLGCRKAVSQGIDWFFTQVEEGIILEDDCLPDASFFSFCHVMLETYKYDTRIGHVSGSNPLDRPSATDGSYRFSFLEHIWGWASWRRAWRYYDVEMAGLKTFADSYLKSVVGQCPEILTYWKRVFKETQEGLINTWDYQWRFALWSQGLLSICPEKNLIQNIGFDGLATHTKDADSPDAKRELQTMKEIVHPRFVQRDWDADSLEMRILIGIQPASYFLKPLRVKSLCKFILKKALKRLASYLRLGRR